ncbi:heavy-metal-associated domain-containing protein [Sphingomonas antarctica]|uniref:heavy-metal-associated domain-containing protein n=1 Tax=Sphingomonas antarctica TaxID=2040274 RepID=UPI0039E856ED
MRRALLPLLGFGALAGAVAVWAQIEGGDRGVPPIDSSGSFEVSGIDVDVSGKSPDAARLGGWRIAQRKGWQLLWAKTHGGSLGGIPADSVLDGLVAGIVVEQEQVGPTRYVAKLGVLFDRARAGALLGVGGSVSRSAPMLVLPVEWSGGGPISYEAQSEWQKAWARYRSGGSPIDYVRSSGSGADPLLLTAGQAQRPGRIWWRLILDQYGAADVLVPQVRLDRRYPGGPVFGVFTAKHGPDGRILGSFTLRAASSDALPALMDEGVRRMDQLYTEALAAGELRPDPSLIAPAAPDDSLLNATDLPAVEDNGTAPVTAGSSVISVQFASPDSASITATESAVRNVPGVTAASTSSLAIGGTSVMRVAFNGDAAALQAALVAKGLKVEDVGGSLRISR